METGNLGKLETTRLATQNGRSITVGKITIKPENWSISQYGAILILDTFNKARRDINYSGTTGDFICDMCEFYRRVMGYTEVEYMRVIGEEEGLD